nr:MAG TPA: hypothetical protein [Caudoviricetes sp.]
MTLNLPKRCPCKFKLNYASVKLCHLCQCFRIRVDYIFVRVGRPPLREREVLYSLPG